MHKAAKVLSMLDKIIRAPFFRDARNLQIIFLSVFLLFGIWFLDWSSEARNFFICFSVAIITQLLGTYFLKIPFDSLKSAAITSLGLTMLFRSDNDWIIVFAAFAAIAGKFIFRIRGKHIFNPANFGIIVSILLFQNGWISPGKWGSSLILLLLISSAGLMVLFRAGRIDTGLGFLITLFILDYFRIIIYQGWSLDVLMHKYMNGSLLLFSFFMITDPATTPNHPKARIFWAVLIAFVTFFLQSFMQVHTAPLWTLFFISPLTPFFDMILKAPKFSWLPIGKTAVVGIVVTMLTLFSVSTVSAFCGFYVAQADAKLFNKSSQVILVRDGSRTVVTMHSDFTGNVKDFAMVVPVPVVLKRNEIRIIQPGIFKTLDAYSGPRLVEYYDENPCYPVRVMEDNAFPTSEKSVTRGNAMITSTMKKDKVVIEAQYTVGEYDILLLSAEESGALKSWLIENDYKIPPQAEEVLEPYIKNNMKFFVVKVNLEEQKNLGVTELRPIQISYESPKFMLPIRLGMANANGDQDMIVYAFSKKGRVECTNYMTRLMPTGKNIPLDIQQKFGKFYKDLFFRTWERHKDAVYVEYAWNVTPSWGGMKCDPCTGPPPLTADLSEAGVHWHADGSGNQVYFTRMHVRYGRSYFPQDLQFQETPNKENYQARYITTHPAAGDLSCIEGQRYLYELTRRRQKEVQNVVALAGWKSSQYNAYMNEYVNKIEDQNIRENLMVPAVPADDDSGPGDNSWKWKFSFVFFLMILSSLLFFKRRKIPLV